MVLCGRSRQLRRVASEAVHVIDVVPRGAFRQTLLGTLGWSTAAVLYGWRH